MTSKTTQNLSRPKRRKVSLCVVLNDAKSHSALSQTTQSLTLCPKRRKVSLCVVLKTQSLTLRRPKRRIVSLCVVQNYPKSNSACYHTPQSLTLRPPKRRKVSLRVSPADAMKSKENVFCNETTIFATIFSTKIESFWRNYVPYNQLPPFSSPSSGLKTRLANTMRR
jgi:hypothetical protein